MTVLPFAAAESSRAEDALAPQVDAILSDLRSQVLALVSSALGGAGCREDFERSLAAVSNEANCSVLRLAIESLDAADEQLIPDGQVYHCGPQTPMTMMRSFGLAPYERRLYRRRGGASIAPADDRFGIVNGFWSPLAARHGLRALALAPAGDCAEMLGELGGMSPSATALNHLVEMVGAAWEVLEEETLESIRSAEVIPAKAAALSNSLDGVMQGMRNEKDEAPQEEPIRAAATGFREASSGTVSDHGGDGERLRTVFFGRMPEAGKSSLKRDLVAEARHATGWRPDPDVVLIADGACDNWTFFSEGFPETTEILDFWHAAQHLKKALDSAHGEHSPEAQRRFEKLRQRLRDEENGIDQVLRSLRHLAKTYPKRKTISRVLKFFRKHRLRMRYAEFQTRKLPIGSGIVGAANRVLVAERMKCSGMRWKQNGTGQPILSIRALCKSGRFHAAWREIIRALQPPPYHLVKRKSGNVAKLMN